MARLKGGKALNNDSIVIVCEGRETEYPYFLELCKSHPNYRVVPALSDVVDSAAKARRNAEIRRLQDGDASVFSGREYYVGLPEVDEVTYEQFKSEPTRWVRAAQLFQERYGYYDAWAVYDFDKRRENAHPVAYSMQTDTLHIAFSAYSFEEWLLLHFERNPKEYLESECKDANDCKVNCGDENCDSDLNCHGEICLGGRLREEHFIPKYEKNKGKDYAQITLKQFHIAYVNAAWSRSLSAEPFYKCNPYSNVDKLVMRLLNEEYDIQWLKVGDFFEINNASYMLERCDEGIKLIRVIGESISVIGKDSVYWCDDIYEPVITACDKANFNFSDSKKGVLLFHKPDGNAILCIKNRAGVTTREYYFEINQ